MDQSLNPLEKLALLNEIGRLALASPDPDHLFQRATIALRAGLGLHAVIAGTYERQKHLIMVRATAGIDARLPDPQTLLGLGDGIIGEACRAGKTVLANDLSADSQYPESIPGVRSELCVPLIVNGEAAAFLDVGSKQANAFTEADVRLLEAAGNLLGQAIHNFHLRRELEDSKNYLEALELLNEVSLELASILDLNHLLERIAQIIRRFIDHDFFAILLVDDAKQEFVWKMSHGFSADTLQELAHFSIHEGIVGRAVRTRMPVLAEDVPLEADYRPIHGEGGTEARSMLALPLLHKDRIVGILMLGSTRKGCFRPHHVKLLTPLAAQIAVSIENAGLYEEKSRDAMTHQVMNEVGKEMTAILELEELLSRIAALLRRVIQYEILGIFIYRPELQVMELKVAIGYSQETIERCKSLPLDDGLLGWAVRERRTILSVDLPNDPRAIQAKTLDGRWTQSEVAVPLVSRDRLLGGLVVESCDGNFFNPARVQILETLASQIAVSIDNARLFQQLLAKEQRLEMDFALARDLQSSMLPVTTPEIQGIEIAALYKPAESLGGDYYDFIWLDENHLGLTIGDVSGKGVAAAMTMAAARSALRFAARIHSSPSQVLYHVNRRLYRDVKKRTYVSLFYGILDLESRMCRWSNGGHFPPVLLRADGSKEEWTKGGTLIALFDKSRYLASQTQLVPGDLICFYTDGIVEARNLSEEEFGRERLEEALAKKARQPAKEILKGLMAELKKFTRGAQQHDDITAFILKVGERS